MHAQKALDIAIFRACELLSNVHGEGSYLKWLTKFLKEAENTWKSTRQKARVCTTKELEGYIVLYLVCMLLNTGVQVISRTCE